MRHTIFTVLGGTLSGVGYYAKGFKQHFANEIFCLDGVISICSFLLVTIIGATLSYFIKRFWDNKFKK